MRLFIAIDLSPEQKESIALVKSELSSYDCLRFVPNDNLHLTLKFLGEIDESDPGYIETALDNVRHPDFSISLDGCGVFPSVHAMRVVWVGVGPKAELCALKDKIDASLGKKPEPLSPHVTIARTKRKDTDAFGKIESELSRQNPQGIAAVRSFTLYDSQMQSSERKYIPIRTYALGKDL